MREKFLAILLIVCVLCTPVKTSCQSCCSGGVPVSANLGFENEEAKILQIAVQADFNILKSLYSEGDLLNDRDRLRTTQSYLVRSAYSFSNKFAAEFFFPFVRQTRKIYGATDVDRESTTGVGDPVLLLKYEIIQNPISFTLGAGLQFPLGSFSSRNSRGIFLVEDLQAGSGALDQVIFASMRFPIAFRQSMNGYINAIYSLSGENPNSRGGQQTYRFGNDLQIIMGMGDEVFIFNQIFSPSLGLRYRKAERDRIDGFNSSATGGEFLFLRLSTGWSVSPTSTLSIITEFPLDIRVNETQLAPTFNFNLGFYKKINLTRDHDSI